MSQVRKVRENVFYLFQSLVFYFDLNILKTVLGCDRDAASINRDTDVLKLSSKLDGRTADKMIAFGQEK